LTHGKKSITRFVNNTLFVWFRAFRTPFTCKWSDE